MTVKKGTVLLVDDDIKNLKLLSIVLEDDYETRAEKALTELNEYLEGQVDRRTQLIVNRFLQNELTELPNGNRLKIDLDFAGAGTLLLLHLPDFEDVTSAFGIEVSNRLIRIISERLLSLLSEGEQLYHYGRAESVILSGGADTDPADIFRRLQESLRNDLLDLMVRKLGQHKLDPANVIVEVLEGFSATDNARAVRTISEMRALGCKIAIDDFGVDNSNYMRIIELNVDYRKIDGRFIRQSDTERDSYLIAQSISLFAGNIGVKTMAEFVSTPNVQKVVLELGIDYSQGYLFHEQRPDLGRLSRRFWLSIQNSAPVLSVWSETSALRPLWSYSPCSLRAAPNVFRCMGSTRCGREMCRSSSSMASWVRCSWNPAVRSDG